jgi:4-hydroxy-tetrahydrodipicolinate reductase
MGRRIIALAAEDPALQVVAAVDRADHPDIKKDAGTLSGLGPMGVPLSCQWPQSASGEIDAVIDFSTPEAVEQVLSWCQDHRCPLVLATTGLTAPQIDRVHSIARQTPVVWSPSMSMAVNLTMKLAALAGEKLATYGPGVDVEIVERHHRFKEDAPSGTALRFGQILAETMGQQRHVHGRFGRPGQRTRDEIGYHALRTGDNPGEHTIVFGMIGETIELTVKATNRDCYALGALAAAKWITTRPAGLYSMADVLGL